ncbi:protein kinase family protein [Bacillus thuringiensis]|uniref:protein kinase family protein n=1 Tax=Bacillus thuringiensis TaxID=1428 RepID=UPI001FADDAF6|nr:protein kinase family protein [Bacillus thuringiensis]MDM8362484.1 protein kinase family protein [Bacillus thuringiensis]
MVSVKDGVLIYLENACDDLIERWYLTDIQLERYSDFYEDAPLPLKLIFSGYHFQINSTFKTLNSKIDSRYFPAEESRDFIDLIDELIAFQKNLENSKYAFGLHKKYKSTLINCIEFLQTYRGSKIPNDFEKINIIETHPLFELINVVTKETPTEQTNFPMKAIGEGSYATVHKYKDPFYNRFFAVKKAHKDLTDNEYNRFRTEFKEMKKLKSPYILEVFKFDEKNRQYIMEYANESLYSYITKNNNNLDISKRINLIQQIFKAFIYIHSKKVLHRDISPTNILIKIYDGTEIIKVSDFGLVKLEQSYLTNLNTEIKGIFNDPYLGVTGFANYEIRHEIYALTRLIYFIITGKTKMDSFTNDEFRTFIKTGTSIKIEERFANVTEMRHAFKHFLSTL